MQFLYQPLTWGFLLVGIPILIHLINLLRHRRVKWAAMDFLLESQRRNRRWILLKQWLLLASRMLAMLLLVTMLAKWMSGTEWLNWFGGQTTHHYVLVDDSYSMQESDQTASAYTRGLQAVSGLLKSIGSQPGQHQLTLVRWSRAALAMRDGSENARLDSAADLLAQSVPQDPSALLERINATSPTSLSLSPSECLELITPLISEKAEQNSEVYLVTDLRRNEFGEPGDLANQLQVLDQNAAKIHVVDCSFPNPRNNLSIVSIEPEQEVWAAQVPLMVRFQIRNRGAQVARNVIVRLRSVSYPTKAIQPQVDKPYSGEVSDLPAVVIEKINPGETVTRQSQVIFGVDGNHVVEAAIEQDSLTADNRRWCTLDIKPAQQVLLIDGDIDQKNAFFFESVVNPNPNLKTGIQVEKQDASYLRDVAPELLSEFDVITLLDVPRLDSQAITKLEDYCKQGGGVFIVCGKNTNLRFINESMYRESAGLFPAELTGIVEVDVGSNSGEPQVAALPHPVLAPLLQLESSPFLLLQIRQMFETANDSKATVETVATGPGGRPLMLDKAYGEGRVLTLLTGLSNDWSTWPQDPTFVVMALRSLGYLGSFRRPETSQPTGSNIEVVVRDGSLLPEAEVLVPGIDDGIRVRLPRRVEQDDSQDVSRLNLAIDLDGPDRNLIDSLLRPGVFEAWMVNAQGEQIVHNFAHNVSPAEGDLELIRHAELKQKLGGIPIEIRSAETMSNLNTNSRDAVHSTLLLCLLGVLLLGEQALAYSASYHAPVVGARV